MGSRTVSTMAWASAQASSALENCCLNIAAPLPNIRSHPAALLASALIPLLREQTEVQQVGCGQLICCGASMSVQNRTAPSASNGPALDVSLFLQVVVEDGMQA